MKLEELQERLQRLQEENEALHAKAEAEKRDWTSEECQRVDANLAAIEETVRNIERLHSIAATQARLGKSSGRTTQPDQPAQLANKQELIRPRITGGVDYFTTGDAGFKSLGEMAWHVSRHCQQGGVTDPRLERLAAASTYGSETVGADGGFAVPPDFRASIMQTVLSEESLLGRCDQVPVDGNQFTCPVDETTPWQTTGGIQAVWDGEAVAATQSKPAIQERTIKANKLRALVPMTEEIMADASAMDAYLRRKAPEKIAFKVNLALIQGTGVGQPLGILNSAALVTVSKQSGQVADTLIGNNVIKMYSRMYAGSRSTAVWLYNQDIEPQLYKLSVPGTDDTGNAVTGWGGLIYMPPGGLSGQPYGTIFGRPAIPTQACETLGDVGDIIFVDLKQYLAVIKSGPNPRLDISMHLWFDQDLIAFKFVLRVGGAPWWSTTVAARDGSATYSPYVALEAR